MRDGGTYVHKGGTRPFRAPWRLRISVEDPATGQRKIRGAGILLTENTALTCTHVIGVPSAKAFVEFAETPRIAPVTARVTDGGWIPPGDHEGDIALLVLDESRPGIRTARLRRLAPYANRPVRMAGYPRDLDNGDWVKATISGPSGSEWVQMEPVTPSHRLRPGFSGAAVVVDDGNEHVIGMVVSEFSDDLRRTAAAEHRYRSYMIPVEIIAARVPQVGERVSVPGVVDSAVDPVLVSDSADQVPDVSFARRLANWFTDETALAVKISVVAADDAARSTTLRRAITLADRELRPRKLARGVPQDTVPPVGSLDLAVDATGRGTEELAGRVEGRMHPADVSAPHPPHHLTAAERVRTGAVPLTIAVVGVDESDAPGELVDLLGALAEQGSRLLLVFRSSTSDSLHKAKTEIALRGRLGRLAMQLEDTSRAGQELRDKRARVVADVGRAMVAIADVEDVRRHVEALRVSNPVADRDRLLALLDEGERAVRSAQPRIGKSLQKLDELLGRRDELRRRLEAFRHMVGNHGVLEHSGIGALYRKAYALLWHAPCALPAAQQAVDAFVQAASDLVREESSEDADSDDSEFL